LTVADPLADHPRGWVGLELIAAYKFIKATLLIAAGLGALGLLNAGWNDATQDWLERLALANTHHLVAATAARALPWLDAPRRLVGLSLGSFLYAGLFVVEGVGLWKCRRWAEYLTIVTTASLLPIEIFAVHQRITLVRVGALVMNVLVVIFLVWQIRATAPPPARATAGTQSAPS
jgi:uncharacterized membrane protein (DUF2068 family)